MKNTLSLLLLLNSAVVLAQFDFTPSNWILYDGCFFRRSGSEKEGWAKLDSTQQNKPKLVFDSIAFNSDHLELLGHEFWVNNLTGDILISGRLVVNHRNPPGICQIWKVSKAGEFIHQISETNVFGFFDFQFNGFTDKLIFYSNDYHRYLTYDFRKFLKKNHRIKANINRQTNSPNYKEALVDSSFVIQMLGRKSGKAYLKIIECEISPGVVFKESKTSGPPLIRIKITDEYYYTYVSYNIGQVFYTNSHVQLMKMIKPNWKMTVEVFLIKENGDIVKSVPIEADIIENL